MIIDYPQTYPQRRELCTVDYTLESSILKLQKDGLRLYGALAEFYFWLGYKSMWDILRHKFLTLAERNMETRRRIVEDTGEMIAPRKSFDSDDKPRTYRLQWQEGTDEPEDEPNLSNGVDVIHRYTPTLQPWETAPSGASGKPPSTVKDIHEMYDISLDRWLKYEEDALRLYSEMTDKTGDYFWQEQRDEAADEVARLKES
jgi:hypothetical protein